MTYLCNPARLHREISKSRISKLAKKSPLLRPVEGLKSVLLCLHLQKNLPFSQSNFCLICPQAVMSNTDPNQNPDLEDEDLLDADEAAEEIPEDDDHPMEEEDDGEEEIQLQNDSAGYFDTHTDSIFCIAQHPTNPNIVVTGGGDDVAYIYDASVPAGPVLPGSYESNPQPQERQGITALQKLDGHKDSVNAVAFTFPKGEYVVTAGLDGQLRTYQSDKTGTQWKFVADASEVQEINWVEPCPDPEQPNVIALGANDGSVWGVSDQRCCGYF